MKTIITLALLLALAVPVGAEDFGPEYSLLITPDGANYFWLPELGYHQPDATGTSYFGPLRDTTERINLGAPAAPFHMVYGDRFVAKGQPGITRDLTLPGGCVLKIQGGIIVGVSSMTVNNGGC